MYSILIILLPFVLLGYTSSQGGPRGGSRGGNKGVVGTEGYCKFKKDEYLPIGGSVTKLGRLDVPKLQSDILNKVASVSGKVGRGVNSGMHGINLVKNVFGVVLPTAFIKAAPILASILGVIGAAMSIQVAENDKSKARMLEYTQIALERLSSQVDKKFDNMQEYFESNLIKSNVETTRDELDEIFESFILCADRKGDAEINDCNNKQAFAMISKRAKFLFLDTEFEARSDLSVIDVKKLEATLPITREYVFKYLVTLQNYYMREQILEADDLH